ncbi:MAG: DUF1501 domain-containing protein [Fimbriiglobus sp.]|jgi:hypothetical protein|nr:DUF1501 domain-containing protein [Fimbriiglobus sp.]
MLFLGRQNQRTCQTTDRRAFLQVGGSSVLGLSLANLLRAKDASKPAGSAKSVVLVWLWGGPSQLDTFDPKPHAPVEFRGPFATIPTRLTGIRFCELFPKLAGLNDRFSLLRTLQTKSNDHGIAGTIGLTGSAAGGTGLDGKPLAGAPQPAMGSVVAKSTSGRDADLPPFLVVGGKLHQGKKAIVGEGGGKLGAMYDPLRLEYDPTAGTKVPALQLPAELTPERLTDRLALRAALDSAEKKLDAAPLDSYRRRAMDMLTSPASRAAFDLGKEDDKTVRRYGRTRFGQSCLLARRLVEAGVPFVQVNWSDHVEAEEDSGDGGWDHHYRNFQIMQDRHAAWLDSTLSAFLTDLDERGLLKTTLVLAVGEFGRQPKINDKAGREHHPDCYSAIVAGGGVKGGRVVGTSDKHAERPADTPLNPADLCATVFNAVGLTSEQVTGMGLTPTGRVIEELF